MNDNIFTVAANEGGDPKASVKVAEVKGLKELFARLDRFPDKVRIKIEKEALTVLMPRMLERARTYVPVGKTGNLRKGFRWVVRALPRKAGAVGTVKNYAPHAHLVEFGHKVVGRGPDKWPRRSRKGKRLTTGAKTLGKSEGGVVNAHPFMRKTLEVMEEDVANFIASYVERALSEMENNG